MAVVVAVVTGGPLRRLLLHEPGGEADSADLGFVQTLDGLLGVLAALVKYVDVPDLGLGVGLAADLGGCVVVVLRLGLLGPWDVGLARLDCTKVCEEFLQLGERDRRGDV